jgi:hypothetical protein
MKYAFAIALALLMGVTELIPATFAAEKDTPQTAGFAAATAATTQYQYGPSVTSDPGTVAGPMSPWFHVPVVEHDSGARN